MVQIADESSFLVYNPVGRLQAFEPKLIK